MRRELNVRRKSYSIIKENTSRASGLVHAHGDAVCHIVAYVNEQKLQLANESWLERSRETVKRRVGRRKRIRIL